MESISQQKQALYSRLKSLVQNDMSEDKDKQNVLKKLPQSFWKFMDERGIKIEEVLFEVPRFVRLKNSQLNQANEQQEKEQQDKKDSKDQKQFTEQNLVEDLGIKKDQIVKIDSTCYALAPSCKINHSKYYAEANLYGMDISSMFAVRCLDLENQSNLLELCSAPGNKSMYACDLNPNVTVTGVQINQNRANVMKNLINKYNLSDRIKIVVQDATKFDSKDLFDRVLVDAQCTHEGSIKHLKKFTKHNQQTQGNKKNENKKNKYKSKQQEKQFEANHNPYTSLYDKKNEWTMEDFQKRFLDPVKLSNLNELQLNLLKNGFRLLKPGGIMVYSTCSIDSRQNQNVVEELLRQNPDEARLMDAEESLKDCPLFHRKGSLKQTVYFTPKQSMCGGMFISKIKKILVQDKKQKEQKSQ